MTEIASASTVDTRRPDRWWHVHRASGGRTRVRGSHVRVAVTLMVAWGVVGTARALIWAGAFDMVVAAFLQRLKVELSIFWLWALLTPAVAAVTIHVPFVRGRRLRALVAHSALASAIALLQGWWFRTAPYVFNRRTIALDTIQATLNQIDTTLTVYLLIVAVVVGRRYGHELLVRRAAEARLRADLSQARLQLLLIQLQPHFLFNTLNIISELVHRDAGLARRMVHRLQALLTAAFDRLDRPVVTLEEELDQLDAYLDIQRARFGDQLTITKGVAADTLSAHVPYLLLQPLVENAVRHGLELNDRGGCVEIGARRVNDVIEIRVRDNGPGPSAADAAARGSEGFGIRSVTTRLRELYGDAASFHLLALSGGGAEALVRLPAVANDRVSAALAGGTADGTANFAETEPARREIAAAAIATPLAPLGVPPKPATPARIVIALLAAWIVLGFVWALQAYALARASGVAAASLVTTLSNWMPNALLWAGLSLPVYWLATRLPLDDSVSPGRRAAHGVAHVVLAGSLLVALLVGRPALGLLPRLPTLLTPGRALFAFWDVAAYGVVVAAAHAVQRCRQLHDNITRVATLQHALASAQLDVLAWRLQPTFLLESLDAIADLAVVDPNRADDLTIRLGELLRSSLQAQGTVERPLAGELVETTTGVWRREGVVS